MANASNREDRTIPDEWWAQYGPSLPTQGSLAPPPGPTPLGSPPPRRGAGGARLGKWLVTGSALGLVVAGGVVLSAAGHVGNRPEWLFGGLGLIGGVVACVVVWAVCNRGGWDNDVNPPRSGSGPRPLQREVTIPPTARPAAPPPRLIIAEAPVPEGIAGQSVPVLEWGTCDRLLAAGPEVAELADELLRKCKDDKRLFDRLVEHEQSRHPYLTWAELLRLAIEHYDSDNR